MKSFSSGEVAQICDVTSRTVIRWIEAGKLKAFKLPGRGNNRVSEAQLVSFLTQNRMPVPEELMHDEDEHCVVVSNDVYLCKHARRILRDADYQTSCFSSGIEAGFEIASKRPSLIILDTESTSARPQAVFSQLKKVSEYEPNIIVFCEKGSNLASLQDSMQVLHKPLELHEFSQIIDEMSNNVV
ncbi:helix-turn-helix domain-containing protein [Glaciecola sp. XM2]|jgi:excisionase family DNA binding protein|uniref:helix-turn-helix domain-containing protein n=1 Tax=Glaciecola sp. XM2 TaxID=1914931 RepID=UPI001BDDFEB8|nr:helix-turn-helix domain-containing protein [Glaciecola sp. XM2]MBT1451820.1 helix-turn-helix domain-containing protein [Glaciecola sp. XM2]